MKNLHGQKKSDRFEDVAKEIGCDESEDALDKAFNRLDPKIEKSKKEKRHKDKK